jgi:hypothetical protein
MTRYCQDIDQLKNADPTTSAALKASTKLAKDVAPLADKMERYISILRAKPDAPYSPGTLRNDAEDMLSITLPGCGTPASPNPYEARLKTVLAGLTPAR